MRNRTCLAAAIAALFASTAHFASAIYAGEVKPADAILAEMNAPRATSRPPKPLGLHAQLRADAKALAQTVASLPAEEAAGRWLALSDRQRAALHVDVAPSGTFEPPVDFAALLAALPTAEQLPALKAALDRRPLDDAGGQRVALLKMLVATLRGDAPGVDAAFDDLRTAALARKTPGGRIDARFAEFRKALAGGEAEASSSLAEFERELEERSPAGVSYVRQLSVPDLVSLVGEERARPLLDRAVRSGKKLRIYNGDATKRIARELALASIESATVPQWSLCESVDAVELYEATAKKFPAKPDADDRDFDFGQHERQQAAPYYLLGLIVRGRSDDALKFATDPAQRDALGAYSIRSAADALSGKGFDEQLYQFLKRVAAADPATPLWEVLVTTAAKAGHANELLQLARDAAAKPGQDAASRRASNRHLADALLSADQVDEGIALLRQEADGGDASDELARVVRLATIGRILGRPELVAEALDDARRRTLALPDKGAESGPSTYAREMRLAGRAGELSAVLAQQLPQIKPESGHAYSVPEPLLELADTYYRADRPHDVLTMFDAFPQWSAADLSKLPIGSGGSHDDSKPAAFYAAWAMLESDRPEQGLRVLDFVLDRRGGLDAAYQLLIDHDPAAAEAKLDALFARDPFEERPLIWKAILQRKAGKLDDAERTLRQAIAIDPSDGEQGKGDRMRVYGVLADVMADKGDAKQADFLRGAVRAIRLSEDADDAWQAGLLTRAIAMYEAALKHFADAYCIQSRMAIQLAELGFEEQAAAHYERAYELMPDSFGRVESHCFGCEGAFRSGAAQGIAERVFTRLLAKSPDKPQLHYLLGYLRTSQGRHGDALPAFRRAVELDPKYLNAWKSLADCEDHVAIPQEERDRAAIAIVSLDPLGRHSSPEVAKVRDVAGLYAAASSAARLRPAEPAALYPLRAAAARIAAEAESEHRTHHFTYSVSSFDRQLGRTAGEAVAENERVKPFVDWMDNFGQ